jgi:hypothetical protein
MDKYMPVCVQYSLKNRRSLQECLRPDSNRFFPSRGEYSEPETDVNHHRLPSLSGLENILPTLSSLAAKISRILDGAWLRLYIKQASPSV